MKIIGVIPARYGSTRFIGKPLHLMAGQTLIEWVIDAARTSKLLNEVIVATDHDDIFQLAQKKGVQAVMTPSDLPSGSDRVWFAAQNQDCDYIINIQGDEPLLKGSQIDDLIHIVKDNPEYSLATLASPFLNKEEIQSQNIVKLILNQYNEAIYFSRFAIPFSRIDFSKVELNHQHIQTCFKHIGMYAYRRDFLKQFCESTPTNIEIFESLEQLRAIWLGVKIKVKVGNYENIGVDTPEDAKKVEKWLLEKKHNLN